MLFELLFPEFELEFPDGFVVVFSLDLLSLLTSPFLFFCSSSIILILFFILFFTFSFVSFASSDCNDCNVLASSSSVPDAAILAVDSSNNLNFVASYSSFKASNSSSLYVSSIICLTLSAPSPNPTAAVSVPPKSFS